jgi:branched-chain amino acid transport system permease protein
LCEKILHWPFTLKSASLEVHLIGSLGMYLTLLQTVILIWGNESRVLRSGVDNVYYFAGTHISQAQLLGGVFSLITLLLFGWWMRRTSFGLQFRAMADNPVLLSILGRDVKRLRNSLFVISSVFAATVALETALDVGFDPFNGMRAIILGMIATIIGGRGTFMGAAIAGFFLGIIRSYAVWAFSARWEEAITFFLLTIILFFRPYGLFGRKLRLEEKA